MKGLGGGRPTNRRQQTALPAGRWEALHRPAPVESRPVPIDLRALHALKRSPMALDIYSWLTYRMSYLKKQTEIPWEAFQTQFGAGSPETTQGQRDFKKNFLKHLRSVLVVYPEANVAEGSYGLLLKPSKSHVPQRPHR